MTTDEANELSARQYPTPGVVIGLLFIAAGAILCLMGISNLDSYFGKDIGPFQIGAGASIALTGIVVFTLGRIQGEIRRNSEILLTIHAPGWRQPEATAQQEREAALAPAMMPCPQCGAAINSLATVCPKCNKKFK